jgi:hypothetical protein
MDAYRKEMSSFRDQLAQGRSHAVTIEAVRAAPDKYRGKLLNSRVYVVSSHEKGVTVKAGAAGGQVTLRPNTMSTGKQAIGVHRQAGANKPVKITYGVTKAGGFMLMAIAPAS